MITEPFQDDFERLDTSNFESFLLVAARRGASVVHFAPTERDLRVRYRMDGELRDVGFLAHAPGPRKPHPITVQLKAAAGCNLAARVPTVGRFSLQVDGRLLSFRVSTIPQVFGERVVVRILDLSLLQDQSLLGYRPATQRRIAMLLERRSGVLVVAGPTGGGRTTTLYSLLNQLNAANREVSALEDPVECYLPGVNQVQLERGGMEDYPTALRGLLRLDPEVVMVGETADPQTADLVFQLAMKGALVLTTVTASSAVGAMLRLVELGVSPQRLAQGLGGVVAQLLLRRLCAECAQPGQLEPLPQVTTCEPVGCPVCRNTGFQGYQSVQEVLEMTDSLKRRLNADLNPDDLQFLALSQGMETLKEDAVYKAVSGLVSLGEALEVSDEPLDRISMMIERTLRRLRGEAEVVPDRAPTRPSPLLRPFLTTGEERTAPKTY